MAKVDPLEKGCRPGVPVPGAPVPVTGVGAVSSFGRDAAALWSALLNLRSAAVPAPPSPRTLEPLGLAGLEKDPDAADTDGVDPRALRRLSRLSRHVVGSVASAFRSVRDRDRWDGEEGGALRDATAVVIGTSFGSSAYHFEYYEKLFRGGWKDASPLLFSESVMNAAAGHVSILWKLRGASLALIGGEEVGLAAIADALDRLRLGEARAVVAGGAEEYCDFVHAALRTAGLVSAEEGSPCSGSEAGTFFGEGAACIVAEANGSSSARASGGSAVLDPAPLAWLAGCGEARALDGAPSIAIAVESAVRQAVADAGAELSDVGLVVASGAGRSIDVLEAEGVSRALERSGGSRRAAILCTPKSALGEGFGFTSAAQAVVAVLALAEGIAPPSRPQADPQRLPRGLRALPTPARIEGPLALAVSVSSRGRAVAVAFRAER